MARASGAPGAAAIGTRIVFAFLLCMAVGMTFAAVLQLSTLGPFEDSTELRRGYSSRGRALGESIQSVADGGIAFSKHVPRKSTRAALPLSDLPWSNDTEAQVLRVGLVKPEVVSWSPRVVVYHSFLSKTECEQLLGLARPRLEKSTVVDVSTGMGVHSKVRTSSGMFLTDDDRLLPFVRDIEKRIAAYSMIPVENGELLQYNLERGGQRIATLLMYLTDNVEGGETIFPDAGDRTQKCWCGGELKPGVCVKPVMGNAVLFWSMGLNGDADIKSMHGGCSVIKGEKWSSTKWMREAEFH
eukprot:SM000120S25701  [mRNA]  locus=s120:228003:230821:+ [translate_table: standard]